MNIKNKTRAKTAIRKVTGHISFGEMINSYRMAQELTQVEMSGLLDITKQDLCNIEKGRKLLSVERAVSFAKALKMPSKAFAKYALQDQLTKAGLKGEVVIQGVA
jgi:DNA-binding XRE family transcriptional regulator